MTQVGRRSINKTFILNKSLEIYWKEGLDKYSFNEIIQKIKVSRTTIYKLFSNEANFQYQTLMLYNKIVIKEWTAKIKKTNEVLPLLNDMIQGIIDNKYTPCLYNRAKLNKNLLSPKSLNLINNIERLMYKTWLNIIKKNLKKKSIEDPKKLTFFLLSQITLLNNLKRNNANKEELSSIRDIINSKLSQDL